MEQDTLPRQRSSPHEETILQIRFGAAGVHLGEPLEHLRGTGDVAAGRVATPSR